jgi:hypothetical protein
MVETRNSDTILVGKSLGKHPPGKLRMRLGDGMKTNLRNTGYEDWT